jgi:hypothetical protein
VTNVSSVIECAIMAKMSWLNPQPMKLRANAFHFKDGKCWLALVSESKGAFLESAQPIPISVEAAHGLTGCLDIGMF